MGLDLSLLPFDTDQTDIAYSHTILDCARRRDLFDAILAVEQTNARPTPPDFYTFRACAEDGEPTYGITTTTPYGEQLQYVTAAALLAFAEHQDVQDNFKNRAIWAYLAALPPDNKVALFWH